MLKTMLTIATLTLVQAVQLPVAHAGATGVTYGGGTTGGGWQANNGLPAHHGGAGQGSGGGPSGSDNGEWSSRSNGGDPKTAPTPQLSVLCCAPHLPPKVHGPMPGPIPGVVRTQ